MNLWLRRRYKFYIHRRGEFWTGTAWTTIAQFGKPYEFHAGLATLQQRFHRKRPPAKLRRCEDFHRKPPPPKAEPKAKKKAKATGNGRRRNSGGASGRLPAV